MSLKIENVAASPEGEEVLTATLRPTAPFSFKGSVTSLRDSGATDINDSFGPDNDWIERPVKLKGRPFLVRLTNLSEDADHPLLELSVQAHAEAETTSTIQDLEAAAEWANRRFLLDVDMLAVREALTTNEYGQELVARYWPHRPSNLPSTWEGLIKTVIGNQIFPGLAVHLLRA